MVYFDCDYMAGAHPRIIEILAATNMEHTPGYGFDHWTTEARAKILGACGIPDGDVFFLTGGTQTNAVVIDRLIGRGEGAMCADSAHINIHESGAIEAAGHKVIPLITVDGKISADSVAQYLREFYADDTWPHRPEPRMVYISHPTELGTLYTLDELRSLSSVCREAGIPLYIDGARLAYALAAPESDVTLADIAALSDIFYIGGTKCGALFGEAVVTRRPELLRRFLTHAKSHGALLAKGRLLGLQFALLFTDGLYFECGRHAIRMARMLKGGLKAKGWRELIDSPTNQLFFRVPNETVTKLKQKVSFGLWGAPGEKETDIRLVTDWSTTPEDVAVLLESI